MTVRPTKIEAGHYELGAFEISYNPYTVYGESWCWSGPSWTVRYKVEAETVYVLDQFNDGEPQDVLYEWNQGRPELPFALFATLKAATKAIRKAYEHEIGIC